MLLLYPTIARMARHLLATHHNNLFTQLNEAFSKVVAVTSSPMLDTKLRSLDQLIAVVLYFCIFY